MSSVSKYLDVIFRSGVSDEMEFQLQKRVTLSNWLGVIGGAVCLVFVFLFISSGRTNFGMLFIMLLLAFSVILLNRFKLTIVSRVLVSVFPALTIITMNVLGKMSQPESTVLLNYATPRLVIASSVVIPFAIFMQHEKWYMTLSISIILSICLFYMDIHHAFGAGARDLGLDDSFYGVIYEDIFVILVILFSISLFSYNLNIEFHKLNLKLLADAEHKNNQMNANEDKLKKTLKEVEEARREDERRNWASTGVGEIVTMIQSNNDIDKLYDRLISKIVDYMGANQGGLYVINENEEDEEAEKMIELASCYAFDRKKFETKRINPGQGILGQVFLEGETCLLTKIPENYVNITSGLGDATPRCLLVVPLKVNEETEGIVELASFKVFEPYQVEFIEKIGETIASAIATNKVTMQTNILLEESREMAEQMKAQEEMMRQNMEELQATQEQLSRKEKEYLEKIEVLQKELEDSSLT